CSPPADTPESSQAAASLGNSFTKFSLILLSATSFFELVVLLLTIYSGFSARRAGASTQGRLVNALRQGNLIYASAMFAVCIASIAFFSLPITIGLGGLFNIFQAVLHGVLATRILFDLREAGKTGLTDAFSVTNMHFASIPMYSIGERSRQGHGVVCEVEE
ncbi:hypothetical protein PAXRUDRAFT_631320, partial [Paxillus rubicundulus Ve08.2h10]